MLPSLAILPPLSLPIAIALPLLAIPSTHALPPAQIPIAIMPPLNPAAPPPPPHSQQSVSLADILGTHRALTTFFTLARKSAPLEALLSAPGDTSSTTIAVLAPTNSAIESLPHKPWEDPAEYASRGAAAYSGTAGQARADDNVRRFVEAHILHVPLAGENDNDDGQEQQQQPRRQEKGSWLEGARAQTLAGRTIWWEMRAGARVLMPDGVEVERVASRVSNGELWILKGVLDYRAV